MLDVPERIGGWREERVNRLVSSDEGTVWEPRSGFRVDFKVVPNPRETAGVMSPACTLYWE